MSAGTPLAADDERHGTATGYRRYGCRCGPCRQAASDYQRAWRRANRQLSAALSGEQRDVQVASARYLRLNLPEVYAQLKAKAKAERRATLESRAS